MKIKEVASNEIHWSIKRWNEGKQANDELRKRLGDTAKYFASCNIGHGYYQWAVAATEQCRCQPAGAGGTAS